MGSHAGINYRNIKKLTPEEIKEAHELSQKAKMEMINTGTVKTICPRCKSKARVTIMGLYGESVRIDCDCGFLAEIEKRI